MNLLAQTRHDARARDAEYDRVINPLVIDLNRHDAEETYRRAESVLLFLRDPGTDFDPVATRFFKILRLTPETDKLRTKNEGDEVVVDAEATRPFFKELSDVEFKNKTDLLLRILVDIVGNQPFYKPDVGRLELRYGKDGLRAKIEGVIQDYLRLQKVLQTKPAFKTLFGDLNLIPTKTEEALRAPFKDGHVDRDLLVELNGTIMMMKLIIHSAENEGLRSALDRAPLDLAGFVKQAHVVDTVHQMQNQLRTALATPEKLESFACFTYYEMSKAALPTEREALAFTPLLNAMKTTFKERSENWICSKEHASYEAQVDSWSPVQPLTREGFQESMRARLENKADQMTNWRERFDREMGSKAWKSLYLVATAVFPLMMTDDFSATRPADQVCRDLQLNPLPDATLYDRPSFILGPMTVMHPEIDQGITYHELGHKLWAALSERKGCDDQERWFLGRRQCLRANHVGETAEHVALEAKLVKEGKPGLYEEEDWADAVSARVNPTHGNFGCALITSVDDEALTKLSLINDTPGDVHSSNLFRVLHLAFLQRGSLPPSCLDAVAARGERADFKSCL